MSHPTRVTIATRIYQPEPAAASFRLATLADALVAAGADVTVLTSTPPPRLSADDGGPVRVRRAPVLRDNQGYVRGYLQYLSFDVPLAFRLLFARRSDVVVAEPPPTTGAVVRAVCALRRVPYVYYAADVWSDASESLQTPALVVRLLRAVESWALRGARTVIAVTDGVAERVRNLGARRVETVRNGIDADVFTAEGGVHPDAPSGPYAVYAGTMSEWQGADVFVDAMRTVADRVPGATLVFLGQGSARERITAKARHLPDGGACVRVLPPVPAAEASAWLRGAAAAVVSLKPGQGYDFAFPTKVYAGLASGAPVLYVGPGEAAGVITQHGLGRAVDYDVDAVAEAMTEMFAATPTETERKRRAAWAEQHSSARAMVARAVAAVLAP